MILIAHQLGHKVTDEEGEDAPADSGRSLIKFFVHTLLIGVFLGG